MGERYYFVAFIFFYGTYVRFICPNCTKVMSLKLKTRHKVTRALQLVLTNVRYQTKKLFNTVKGRYKTVKRIRMVDNIKMETSEIQI